MAKTKKHFSQEQFVQMYKAGKSVGDIETKTGASGVWIRRALHAAGVFKSSRKAAVKAVKAIRKAGTKMTKALSGNRGQSQQEVIAEISRSVAASAFAGATMTPAATTREQMWNDISKGVEQGVKRVMGFQRS